MITVLFPEISGAVLHAQKVSAHLNHKYLKKHILLCLKILLKYSWFVVCLISALKQSDSVRNILFHILFHYGLSQDVEYSSLWYAVGTCLSVLYVFASANPRLPGLCSYTSLTLGNHKSVIVSGSLFLFCRYVCFCSILDSTYKWYHLIFVSLKYFTYSLVIPRSIHIAVNGIISFF